VGGALTPHAVLAEPLVGDDAVVARRAPRDEGRVGRVARGGAIGSTDSAAAPSSARSAIVGVSGGPDGAPTVALAP